MKKNLLLLLVLLSQPLFAHPLDLGLILLQQDDDGMEVSLDVNPSLAALLLGVEVTHLTQPLTQSRYGELFEKTLGTAPLMAGAAPCTWSATRAELLPQSVRLTSHAACPKTAELHWSFPFLHRADMPRTFQILLKANFGATEQIHTADAAHDSISLSPSQGDPGFGTLVTMGITHIGAAPGEWWGPTGWHFPEGIDHILFLLALILAGGTMGQMVKTATGFTVGHSITLAAASFGLVTFPQRVVESAIALSIAYVALETLFIKEPKARWKIAGLFGLVHGLGFASALGGLSLSGGALVKALIGFNLGVEIGQVVLVGLMAPLVAILRQQPWLRLYAVPGAAGGIFMAGAYWFIRRAFAF